MLKSDLQNIGCAGLLERPWNLKNEEFIQQFVMIREHKLECSNIFDTTIRDRPEEWTAGVWREVYDFQLGGGSKPTGPTSMSRVSSGMRQTVAPLASASYLIHSSQWRKPHGSL